MDVHLMRRRSRINLKSAWISAPALLHAGQARLILGAEPTMQQAGPLAAWSRSLTRPPALPLSRNLHSRAPAALLRPGSRCKIPIPGCLRRYIGSHPLTRPPRGRRVLSKLALFSRSALGFVAGALMDGTPPATRSHTLHYLGLPTQPEALENRRWAGGRPHFWAPAVPPT